jgi:beta-lactamase class A
MDRQLDPSRDNCDITMAQLKAKLERTYRGNEARRSNTNLKSRVAHSPVQRDPFNNRVPHQRVKKKVIKRRRTLQSSVNQLSLLFVIMVAAVTGGFVCAGKEVTRSKPKLVSMLTPTTSASPSPIPLPRLFSLPSHPPTRPAWAIAKSLPVPFRQPERDLSEIVYNLQTPPNLTHSQQLQTIVDEVVALASAHRFPKKSLSITLINAKTGETAGYQEHKLRYPASVVKMFWMVDLYAQLQGGIWSSEQDFHPYIAKMIEESNNEAASFLLDEITGTESLPELTGKELNKWVDRRLQVSRFFQQAGYKDIIVSQKTFPIYYLKANEPIGNDLRIRQILKQPDKPFRNLITTEHAARLMYEICYTHQAVANEASKKMCEWIKRDLNPSSVNSSAQNHMEFNPVRSFFGEALVGTNVNFYSKAGWTSRARNEVALVETPDGKTVYILAIFGADKAYAQDGLIFPKMCRLVYRRMTNSTFKQ